MLLSHYKLNLALFHFKIYLFIYLFILFILSSDTDMMFNTNAFGYVTILIILTLNMATNDGELYILLILPVKVGIHHSCLLNSKFLDNLITDECISILSHLSVF